ncbi:Beta-glucosidase (SUN family) domain containing protein [Naviculisporaceae sp. PSN 640]
MVAIIKIAVAAAMVAGVAASHDHQHLHRLRHAKRAEKSGLGKRDTVYKMVTVEGPTKIEYVMDGQTISAEEAEKGIEAGKYAVVGETEPSFVPPPPVLSTSVAPTSKTMGAMFVEKETSTSSSAPPPEKTPEPDAGVKPVDRKFPSGEIDCSDFQEVMKYGPIDVPWVGQGGWTTLMKVGHWTKGVKYDNIKVGIKGDRCSKGDLCSFACPPGYQKTQWPEGEQGATGQSVGGIFCNDKGKLELTRPSHPTLCEPGVGGVYIRNELDDVASLCRTDYPASEEMNIPLLTTPGGTFEVTNPESNSYYVWEGNPTTAQYYLNNKGLGLEDACVWVSKVQPQSAGNWAPVNIGTGLASDGNTYLSIFPNAPTTTAILDYDVELEGDISEPCWLRNGVYSKPNGCTVAVPKGGKATIVLKKRGAK